MDRVEGHFLNHFLSLKLVCALPCKIEEGTFMTGPTPAALPQSGRWISSDGLRRVVPQGHVP